MQNKIPFNEWIPLNRSCVIQTRGQSKKDDPLDKQVLFCRQERNIYYRSGKKLQ